MKPTQMMVGSLISLHCNSPQVELVCSSFGVDCLSVVFWRTYTHDQMLPYSLFTQLFNLFLYRSMAWALFKYALFVRESKAIFIASFGR